MNLDILTCGGMQVTARILVGDVSDPAQLFGGDLAKGQLDPHHLNTGLTLAVYASRKAKASKLFVIDFTIAEKADFFLKVNDITGNHRVIQIL
jgi:hypothetical protein